jgi:hypothetical protein
MAFALASAYLYKVDTPSHVRKYGWQVAEFEITRDTSDTDLDIGDVAGTFWTAVGSSGLGERLLSDWTRLVGDIEELVSLSITSSSGFLLPSVGDAALAAGGTASVQWAGGSAGTALNANSVAQTLRYQQNGEFVTLHVPGYLAAAKGAAPGAVIVLKSDTLLPAALRPVVDTVVRIRSQDNAAYVAGAGMAVIKTTGQIEIYLDGTGTTAYTVTANAGFDTFTVSYRTSAAPVAAGTYQLANGDTYPALKPNIVLPVAAPTSLKVVMVLSLEAQTRPIEFGV